MAHPATPVRDQVHTDPDHLIKPCLNGNRTPADHLSVPTTPADLADLMGFL